MSCCRITHPASGAVAECQEERSYEQNKKRAFIRLLEKPEFKQRHKIECAKRLGLLSNIDDEVSKAMCDKNLLVEMLVDGKWVRYETRD